MSSLWSERLGTYTKGHQSQISRQDSHPSAQTPELISLEMKWVEAIVLLEPKRHAAYS